MHDILDNEVINLRLENSASETLSFLLLHTLLLYFLPDGLEADKKEGTQYFEKACENGFYRGCSNAGKLLLDSKNTELYPKALSLLAQACEKDERAACVTLGMAYLQGLYGVEKDPKKTVPLLRKACDLGSVAGCTNACVMYRNGDGVPQNEKIAEKYQMLAQRLMQAEGSFKKGIQLGRGSK